MKTTNDAWTEAPEVKTHHTSSFTWTKQLPTILRILGAGAIIVAMYSFLFKGWENTNDLLRYVILLSHTGLLSLIGISSSHWLKENKGARLFLALTLVAVPVNFAILGAFIYGQTSLLTFDAYPEFMTWSVDSLQSALTITGVAIAVLYPAIWLSFRVMAKEQANALSGLFILGNLILLLPVRESLWTGILVFLLATCVMLYSQHVSNNSHTSRTREGFFALAVLALPLAVFVGRSLWLYRVDTFLIAILALIVFFILRQIIVTLASHKKLTNLLNVVSLVPVIYTGYNLSLALAQTHAMPDGLNIPIGGIVATALVYDIARRSQNYAHHYRMLAMLCLLACLGLNLLVNHSLLSVLITIITGICLAFLGFKQQQKSVFGTGTILILMGVGNQLHSLLHDFDFGSWASLAVFGIIAIVIASLMESKNGKIKTVFNQWRIGVTQWEK